MPPTVDNVRESLLSKTEEVLGLGEGELLPTHRLDGGTQGVVVLARTQAFARHMQMLLRDKTLGSAGAGQDDDDDDDDDSQRGTAGPGALEERAAEGAAGPSGGGAPAEATHTPLGARAAGADVALSRVRKTYRCVSALGAGPPPLGRLVHWVQLKARRQGACVGTGGVLAAAGAACA